MSRPRRARPPRHARWQALLAVAAIASAVSLPVVLVGVGGGVDAHEISSLEQTGYQIVVSAEGSHGIEFAHRDAARLLALPNVVAVEPVLSIAIDVFNRTGNVSATLAEGIVPAQFAATLSPAEQSLFPPTLLLGDPNDTAHYARGSYDGPTVYNVLLSAPYAQAHRVTVGSTVVLSPTTNASLGVRYNVSGLFGPQGSLFEPAGAFAALVLLSNLQVLTGYGTGPGTIVPDGADTIEVVAAPAAAESPGGLAGVEQEVQAALPSYTVTSVSSEAAELRAADGILTGFYLALSSVGLAVGLLFLALVLVRRVERDRRAIAIRRAIGLSQRSVGVAIVEDGVFLATAGAAVGVVAGVLLVDALATWGSSTVREAAQLAIFAPGFVAELVAGVVALSAAASAAAVRAAWRVNLLEALR